MLVSAVVADSNSVVLSTPLRMEVQLWVLDERMMQTMFLAAMALKRVVQQWDLADWEEVVTPLKRVVQMCAQYELELCAISLEVVTPQRRLMTTAH